MTEKNIKTTLALRGDLVKRIEKCKEVLAKEQNKINVSRQDAITTLIVEALENRDI